ncbi:MAG: DegT/DnrJ/EryC1/StrS family aminotransferase [Parvicellaceae bacterium]|tara:strand:+ start:4498 stop:5640 length:1143 start_codon:yes stop_codon:yes gene_type:complete
MSENNLNIQMVDLKSQYMKIKPQVDQAINDVLSSTQFINGEHVKSFQNELAAYLDVKHVITCANGTDALQISMMALGLKPGDEIITPSFTYIATTEVIGLLGLKPVFVDCNPENFNISVDEVEKAITKKTKAIVPVHLFGQSSDMKSIMSLAKKYNLFVIEDNAQAIGSDYLGFNQPQKTGTIGNIGCTSFFPSKNLGCFGDGGAMMTNDDELAKKLRMIANHGQSKRYYHDIVGCNSRLDNIQAAVLRIKLKELDQYILNRQKAANYYDQNLKNLDQLTLPFRNLDSNHVFHQYTLKLDDSIVRDELIQYLAEKNIPAMVYYPVPAHRQKMFSKIPNSYGNMKVTNWLSSRVFSLPMHTELSTLQQDYIIENISNFLNK